MYSSCRFSQPCRVALTEDDTTLYVHDCDEGTNGIVNGRIWVINLNESTEENTYALEDIVISNTCMAMTLNKDGSTLFLAVADDTDTDSLIQIDINELPRRNVPARCNVTNLTKFLNLIIVYRKLFRS